MVLAVEQRKFAEHILPDFDHVSALQHASRPVTVKVRLWELAERNLRLVLCQPEEVATLCGGA